MVKSLYAANREGLRDWLIQHISALLMAIYTIGLVVFFIINSPLDYLTWFNLFSHGWMKISTAIIFFLLLFHAWIGIWTVLTDYVTCSVVRLTSYVFVLLALMGLFIAMLLILWGI